MAIGPTICLHDPPSASARSPISPFVQSGRTHPPIRLPDPTGRSDHPPDPPVAARTHPFASALAYPSVPARGGLDGFLHNRTPKPSVSYPPDPVSTPPPQPVALSAHSCNPVAPIRPIRPAVAIGPTIYLHNPPCASARSPISPSCNPVAPIRPIRPAVAICRMVYLHGLPAVRRGIGTPGKGICPPPEPDNSCRQPHPDLSRTPLRLPVSTTGGTKSAGRRWNEKTGSPGPGRDAAGQEFQ